MDPDIEEGEVVDSQPSSAGDPAVTQVVSWRSADIVEPLRRAIPRHDSSSSDEGERSDTDSENDVVPYVKKRICAALPVASAPRDLLNSVENGTGSVDGIVGVSATSRTAAQRRNKHNIWGAVLQEQTLSSELIGWSGVKRAVVSDRNVETYDYLNARNDTRPLDPESPEADTIDAADGTTGDDDVDLTATNDFCDKESFGNEVVKYSEKSSRTKNGGAKKVDLCDIESFGVQSNRSYRWGKNKQTDSDSVCGDENGGAGDACNTERKMWTRPKDGFRKKASVQERLGERSYDVTKDRSHIRVTATDPAANIVEELLRVLEEPPQMKDMFTRVVDNIGAEKSLSLLYITEDLEQAGGIMTLDGSRRRTPGGVYLYLLKGDKSISRDQQKAIFIEQRESYKRKCRIAKAEERRMRHSGQVVNVTMDVDTVLPNRADVFMAEMSRVPEHSMNRIGTVSTVLRKVSDEPVVLSDGEIEEADDIEVSAEKQDEVIIIPTDTSNVGHMNFEANAAVADVDAFAVDGGEPLGIQLDFA